MSVMETKKIKSVSLTDRMVLIGFGLAAIYWFCESLINFFLSNQHGSFISGLLGPDIHVIQTRMIVLCLFIIYGSHAQFTMNQRQAAAEALKKSEERYRSLVQNIPIGMYRQSPDGRFLMANPAFYKMLGFESEQELRNLKVSDIYFSDRERKALISQLLDKGNISWLEVRLKRKDGNPLWGLITAKTVYEEKSQELAYFDCTVEDINERKKAQERVREEEETRRRFEKLLSPDLAELIASGKLRVEQGGESRFATVLFADIRGFTTLSENTPASEVLTLLNKYFEIMVSIVFRYEGTVDKFIGDSIMVNWGAPIRHEDDAIRAVSAAIDMQHEIIEFNKNQRRMGRQEINVGIGINTGHLVAGYIGSSQTMSYSVIGDAVNTASRLCSAAKGGQIIITEATCKLLGTMFITQKSEPIQAKGKFKPINVFNVIGYKGHK